jgi:hypothetical protein
MMSNGIPLTYEQAVKEAQSYIDHKEKLHELLDEVNGKAEQHEEFLIAAWENLQIFVRLLRPWLGGDYYLPVASLLMIVALSVLVSSLRGRYFTSRPGHLCENPISSHERDRRPHRRLV